MKLIGSTTSPFVRRLRLYLAQQQINDYEFVNLDIFASKDRLLLTQNNPAQKVPALHDDEQCIYDSRVIFRYLAQKFQQTTLTWQQENLLTLIDAVNDSIVSILLLNRSEIDTTQDKLFFNLQHERVEQVMGTLSTFVDNGEFKSWGYPAICLFCLLDWVKFRELYDFSELLPLTEFHKNSLEKLGVNETNPR